jgi:predicted amidophosphoribosyltransferase
VVISNPEDELEMLIADRRRSRLSKADGFCPNCGAPHQISDLFCPKCGERISMKSL